MNKEPEEGDYISTDGGHTWYQDDKLILTWSDEDFEPRLRYHAEKHSFWPNAWLISDHGNAHLTSYL